MGCATLASRDRSQAEVGIIALRILGLPVPFTGERAKALNSVMDNRGGVYGGSWISLGSSLEPFAGAWQRNIRLDHNLAMTYHAVFSCETLIASDIAKLRVKLVEQDASGLWSETTNPAYSPVLRRPNPYQSRIQFWEHWILSKLSRGNTYALKQRDQRGVVNALYILDPTRVTPLVADDGSVFYRLNSDTLSGMSDDVVVPAREIIHDRFNCMFHPLVGISPLFASGLAATQGLNIQSASVRLFENNSTPGGLLIAPTAVTQDQEDRMKAQWEQNFCGKNVGRVAILQNNMRYEKMTLTAVEGQLIEQLKWSADVVCSTFHVPPYKIGIGPMPTYNNIQALNVEYFSQCLQSLLESAELCLDEGLEMAPTIGTEFDLENLLRMDSMTQVTVEKEAVLAGIKSPNESRRRFDLKPVTGGEGPYLQQQNYSLAALAKRDAQADPFAPATPPAQPAPTAAAEDAPADIAAAKQVAARKLKALLAANA
jgi:HK97 family phage portal protein